MMFLEGFRSTSDECLTLLRQYLLVSKTAAGKSFGVYQNFYSFVAVGKETCKGLSTVTAPKCYICVAFIPS